MKKILTLFILSLAIISCNSNKKPKKEVGSASLMDSLIKEIDDIHITGMSKMAPLTRFQQQATTLLDSISKLPNKESMAGIKNKLETLATELSKAEADMENWMNDFYNNPDTLADNETERTKYLEDQKIKVTAVRNAVLRDIQKADSLFKTKF